MLSELTGFRVLEIAEAEKARNEDQKAMEEYLHPERDARGLRSYSASDLHKDAEAGAFDSPERHRLTGLIETLSSQARWELIALMWVGRGTEGNFNSALKTAKRNVPAAAQVHYITAKPLHRYLTKGLKQIYGST